MINYAGLYTFVELIKNNEDVQANFKEHATVTSILILTCIIAVFAQLSKENLI